MKLTAWLFYLCLSLCAGAVCCQEALDSLAGPSLLSESGSTRHVAAHLTKPRFLPQHQTVLQSLTDRLHLCWTSSALWYCSSRPIRGCLLKLDHPVTAQGTDLWGQSDGDQSVRTVPGSTLLHVGQLLDVTSQLPSQSQKMDFYDRRVN